MLADPPRGRADAAGELEAVRAVPAPIVPRPPPARGRPAPARRLPPRPFASRRGPRRHTPRPPAGRCCPVRAPMPRWPPGGRSRSRASRRGRPGLHPAALVDLELGCGSPTPFTVAVAAGAGSAGRATTRYTGLLARRGLRDWPTRTPGTSVIALRSPSTAGRPGRWSRQRVRASVTAETPRRPSGRRAGTRRDARPRRPSSARGRSGRTVQTASGNAGGTGSPRARRSGREFTLEQLRLPPPQVGTGIAVTRACV